MHRKHSIRNFSLAIEGKACSTKAFVRALLGFLLLTPFYFYVSAQCKNTNYTTAKKMSAYNDGADSIFTFIGDDCRNLIIEQKYIQRFYFLSNLISHIF